MTKYLISILSLSLFISKTKAQDILVTLSDNSCNIGSSNFGKTIDKIYSNMSITFVVTSSKYYSIDNATETIRQTLKINRDFSVLINDSIEKALNKNIKSKKDWGGHIFQKRQTGYAFITPLSELSKSISLINATKIYDINEKVISNSPDLKRLVASCPFCSFYIDSLNFFLLSFYSAQVNKFIIDSGLIDTLSARLNFLDSTNFLSFYAQLNNNDTAGYFVYRKRTSFNPILPFSIKMMNKDAGISLGVYYSLIKDSLNTPKAGPSSPCAIHFNVLNNTAKLIPIRLNNCPYSLRLNYYVSLNDSQIIFLLSNIDAVSRSGQPLFGLFRYENNEIVFDKILTDYTIPNLKNEKVGYIPLFNNKHVIVPNTGEIININNISQIYALDYKNISSFLKMNYKVKINLEKATWIDFLKVNEQVSRVLFFFDNSLYILYINNSTKTVLSSQIFISDEISKKISVTRLVEEKIYYISKSGSVNMISLK
jgi:hypothetical protein